MLQNAKRSTSRRSFPFPVRDRRVRLLSLLLLAMVGLPLLGCQSIRGVMYLDSSRVGDYLAKNENKLTQTDAVVRRRKLMRDIPDANRVLGGFCTDAAVKASILKVRKMASYCRERTQIYARTASLQGSLFWGFLISTVATGTGMIITGAAIPDPEIKGWTAFAFGATTFTLAMINGLGGFDGRQTVLSMRAKKIDNFMWTMRLRMIAEVCNAKSVAKARREAAQIVRDTREMCVIDDSTDGYYQIPDRSNK